MPPHLQGRPLRFHPLAYLEDGGEVVVGRSDIDSYGVFPHDGAALVRELVAGRDPTDAAEWYAHTYGERVDMVDFVATLRELQLVRDDQDPAAAAPPARVRGQRLGRAMFSAPAWVLYAALIAAGVVVCALDGRMLPRTDNVFFVDSLLTVAAAVFAGQIALTVLHEAFHVLAGRRLGIGARVGVSRRMYFVVLETNLDGLAVVARRRRYLPILAGLLADALAVAGLTVVAYLAREQHVISGLCLALAFTTLPRMAWQFYLFLRTDIYHLVATATGCVDLDTVARQLIANRVNALLGRHARLHDESAWHPRDLRIARFYAPVMVIGYAWMLVILAPRPRPARPAVLGLRSPARPHPLAARRRAGDRRARATPRKEDDMTSHLQITAGTVEPEWPLLARVDAHRRLRGPYTAAGSLVRAIVPGALARCQEVVARHDVEVLTVAPELEDSLTCERETLTSLAPPEERTRFYPPARTQRIAHGLTELLRDVVRSSEGDERRALVIERAGEADPTERNGLRRCCGASTRSCCRSSSAAAAPTRDRCLTTTTTPCATSPRSARVPAHACGPPTTR